MASPVTEIAYITLKPGVDIESSTQEAKTWQETLATVAAQDGYQRAYFGRQLEDPSILMYFIDWDSQSSHQKFIASPAYQPFTAHLSTIMTSVHFHHAPFTPHPLTLLTSAPCIEVATFYNAAPDFVGNVEKFASALKEGKPEGYFGATYGKVLEEDVVKHKDVGQGVGGAKAVVLLIGWESREVHLQFRETPLFKENIGLLREKNGGAELFHVSFKAV